MHEEIKESDNEEITIERMERDESNRERKKQK